MERRSPGHVQRTDEVSVIGLAAPPTLFPFLWMAVHVHERPSRDLKAGSSSGWFVVRFKFDVRVESRQKQQSALWTWGLGKRMRLPEEHFCVSATKIRTIFCFSAQFCVQLCHWSCEGSRFSLHNHPESQQRFDPPSLLFLF